MRRSYNDLSPNVKEVFNKLGFVELDNMGKPYYAGLKQGKIYRVKESNKLKEMKDGATPRKYGRVKLKQSDGRFKTFLTHRLIASFKENPNNDPIVHHETGLKNHNGIDELEWTTHKQNTAYYFEKSKASKCKGVWNLLIITAKLLS